MNITIEQIAELVKIFVAGDDVVSAETPAVRQIVKVEGGWIFYGDVSRRGDEVVVRNGGTVRFYCEPNGGLNRLASHKPSDKTKLDPAPGAIRFPASKVYATVDIQSGGI
ncbi:MAG: hypothetical protein AAGB48_03140 [Planctomycetota bacterium]